MKKILAMILTMALIFSFMTVGVSADTSEVTLTGEILTTIINVDIPTSASFTINPNIPEGTEGRYVMPSLRIFNATTAPITLSIIGFDNKAESENQFTEVARNDRDWGSLGATESSSYIYLGVTGDSDQFGFLNHTELLSTPSAIEVQTSEQELCHIRSDTRVDLDIECQSGSAFPNALTSVYELVFVASLYKDEVAYSSITDVVVHNTEYYDWNADAEEVYRSLDDKYQATLTIIAESPDTNYLINGLDFFGSQTITVDTLDMGDEARYVTIQYVKNDLSRTTKFIFN